MIVFRLLVKIKSTDRMIASKKFNDLNFCFDAIYRDYGEHAMTSHVQSQMHITSHVKSHPCECELGLTLQFAPYFSITILYICFTHESLMIIIILNYRPNRPYTADMSGFKDDEISFLLSGPILMVN